MINFESFLLVLCFLSLVGTSLHNAAVPLWPMHGLDDNHGNML